MWLIFLIDACGCIALGKPQILLTEFGHVEFVLDFALHILVNP